MLSFYNFTGLSCLKFSNGVYEISHLSAFINIVKIITCLILIYFVSSSIELQRILFRHVFIVMPDFSYFSKMSINFAAACVHYFSSVLFIHQFVRRHGMKRFMNNALFRNMNQIYLRRFIRLCVSTLRLALCTVVVTFIKYLAIINPSFVNFLVYLVYIFPSIIALGFVSFVKNFESYVVVSLQKFDEELKQVTCREARRFYSDIEIYLRFSYKYQKLFDFVNEFNDLFGHQMTIQTNALTIITILLVSSK